MHLLWLGLLAALAVPTGCPGGPGVPERVTVVGFVPFEREPADALQMRLVDQQARNAFILAFDGYHYEWSADLDDFTWDPRGNFQNELSTVAITARDVVQLNGLRVYMATITLSPGDVPNRDQALRDWERAERVRLTISLMPPTGWQDRMREPMDDPEAEDTAPRADPLAPTDDEPGADGDGEATGTGLPSNSDTRIELPEGLSAEALQSIYDRALHIALRQYHGSRPGPVSGSAWIVRCAPRLEARGSQSSSEYRYRAGLTYVPPLDRRGITFDIDVRILPDTTNPGA